MLLALTARLVSGQTTSRPASPGATVTGVVRDSLAHRALADALVQLTAADLPGRYFKSTSTDPEGHFSFSDVPDGRYIVGFLHPTLDSIGLEEPAREVVVREGRAPRIDLALPSARRLRAAICPGLTKDDSTGIVLGFVRGAIGQEAVAGAVVTGQWAEFVLTKGGLSRSISRVTATTAANGWFALCSVPAGAIMAISATHASDTTALIEVEVSPEGFVHRDLSIGASASVVVVDTAVVRSSAPGDSARVDSVATTTRLVRTGTGRLSGTVRRSPGDAPLPGAQISILDGPQTRADEAGAWTIANAPLGSRTLEVRAVGYYPERRTIDVTPQTAPIASTLPTLKAVLDTVRVRATTIYARDRNGFQQRRRTGMGRYISADDIARRHPIYVSDMLRTTPGLFVQTSGFSRQLVMRGTGRGFCEPTIYLDGMPMFSFGADDLDAIVQPGDVGGIEVYSATTVPPQFQRGMSGCGSVVIWTK